ncbi:N-acetylmuramoyl-L-alanine amidase [Candidatus Dojkabacteria bacterium]|uniref:N-acetylmuramoyl-L-alanine amidase n=1 Tax=Candidatus Dojkabacteria bacterium TaxID=2099670 RepID=A0A955I7T8_9BACT|nr:N-acetylmuramoyl-L-alanine amidase [Candidatus Dojkabacteria bacterium]
MPRAILSSGHTSADPGSKANDLVEYELSRKISRAVLPYLRQHGIITLSVPADLDLLKRIEWINKTGYDETNNDVAIEIHINEGGKSGIESWYEGEGDSNSKKLSDILVKSITTESGLPDQGSKSEYEHEIGSIAFLHDVNSITTLVECGYIDNEADAKFLKDDKNIDKLAKGVAKGVLEYFGVPFRDLPQGSPPVVARPNPSTTTPPVNQFQQTPMPANNFQIPSYNSGGMQGFDSNLPQSQPTGGFMSRDDRKKMVNEMYTKILGREPTQNDLNYFLNIGISEQDLLKKMVDSQEHADLVKSRQEVIKAKEELNQHSTELLQLRASAEDQKVIIRNLHALIAQKNQAIAHMQQQLGMMQNYQNAQQSVSINNTPTETKHNYRGTFLDKLFKAFSDLFE